MLYSEEYRMFNDPVLLKLAVWAAGFLSAVGAVCCIMALIDEVRK